MRRRHRLDHGDSYIVYGPLCNGTTSVLYEGTPDYPDKDRWWEIIERYGVTILYTAPTAIRSLMRWGAEFSGETRSLSLRLMGRVGEPINPRRGSGTASIAAIARGSSTRWWQTETGRILITPLPG